jgi:rhombotail lipoprotein
MIFRHSPARRRASTLLLAAGALSGCGTLTGSSQHRATSVVQYLYPGRKDPVAKAGIPVLRLPLRVGVAFVPDEQVKSSQTSFTKALFGGAHDEQGAPVITERDKMALMQTVSERFKKYPFVGSIELIPSAYLTPGGSFDNLEQLRSMFGIDVIALLSYDQVQFTDEGFLSLTYWTLGGAYLVKGEKNDTRTLMDAVVYDIESRKLLFRAPGVGTVKASSTPVNLSEQLRADSRKSFELAANDLAANLDQQLELFREKVKNAPEEYQVVHRPDYKGGGGTGGTDVGGGFALVVLALLGGGLAWSRGAARSR